MKSGGHLLVDCLKAQGVDRIFCVPGESYLDVLDGLHGSGVEVVVCRQEGGVAMMAEADAKFTGRPGVAMVTRGPGATNASAGVHVARQDSTPMVLFVGQIGRDMDGREAFQEVDYGAFFGSMAKWVTEIDNADRIPEIISHAWHVAMSGRPGPVVISLPEDMLADETDVKPGPYVEVAEPAPRAADARKVAEMLSQATCPILITGGSRWSQDAVDMLVAFSERWSLPVSCTFRRQHLFPQTHPNYAGDSGLGINPELKRRVAESDLVLLLGGRFSENPSQGFTVFDIPEPKQALIHIHPGAEEIGRIYAPDLGINATPHAFLEAMQEIDAPRSVVWEGEAEKAHKAYCAWSDDAPPGVGAVTLSSVICHLRDVLPEDSIFCNGAGNFAIWVNRFYRFQRFATQIAPTSGSMGYGLPAAVASSLRCPDRTIVCMTGDGDFQMTMQEFGTAVQAGAKPIVIVCDNATYGTIRMHQEREYPGRVEATRLVNPDFAALAASYGAPSFTVERDDQFADAFAAARDSGKASLIHLKLDPRDLSPSMQLNQA